MKKLIITSIVIIVLLFTGWIIYVHLPVEITERSNIKYGNELIEKLDNYKITYSELPKDNDWELLKKLGFKEESLGISPCYTKINKDEYELVYLRGFDGPYLFYNSTDKEWKVGFPKFPVKE